MQDREKEMEIGKLKKDIEAIEREKSGLLKEVQELKEKAAKDGDNTGKVLELEATNEQLSSIIHQMRIDMENLQEEFKGSNEKDEHQDNARNQDLLKQNNCMKIEIADLQTQLRKLTLEKNRLVSFKIDLSKVDISNSVRSHIRNWKEAQENRHDRSTQSIFTSIINLIAIIVLNTAENKDSNVARNQKVLVKQSDKETASQNKSRTKLTKSNHTIKALPGELPEKFQASMQNRALGIRNWNNIHD